LRLKTPRDLELSAAASGTTPASTSDNIAPGHAWAFLQPIARAIFSPEEQRCFA
jgi:hypothetical protein